MQLAQIVPKIRTQKETIFDYSIPPEILPQVKAGILVKIPFHGRDIEGIVVDIKRSSPINILKPISEVIDPVPAVDEIHLKLACWMADYYLEPLSKTLFENIVPPAKRIIKKISFINKNLPHTSNTKNKSYKKYLIVADFSSRMQFYLKAINNTIAKQKSVIILLPDLSLIPYFSKYFKNSIEILHAKMTRSERWRKWDLIRQNNPKIIIGSQSALFAPVKNLGLIIIDQEENETFKNSRSPRFHFVKAAEKLSQLSAVNLILGSLTPRIETFNRALKGDFKLLKIKMPVILPKITIVDMNYEKYIISNTLEKQIDYTLQNNQKILLVLNRKGEGTKFSCLDCGWIAHCPKCGLPLIPEKFQNICFHCQINLPHPEKCPKCQGINLKPMGIGTSRLKKFLTDLFPKINIVKIEKEIYESNIQKSWQIAIVTTFALKFNLPNIGLVGIIDTDQGLNFPDFSSSEKNFSTFYKFLKVGERGIIQTHLPQNYLFKSLARLDYERFFLDEMINRKKFSFPPFVRIIRLLYKNQDEVQVNIETQRVYEMLKQTVSDNQSSVSPPYWPFIKKERGKFRRQIIIKIRPVKKLSDEEKEFLKSLSKGWILDVDPLNIL